MLSSFKSLILGASKLKRVNISVAVAQDMDILQAVKAAYDLGFVQPILVGDDILIKQYLAEIDWSDDIEIISAKDQNLAALIAVELVSSGKADVLMKGLINTSDFLKAVLDKKIGLRQGKLLSHLAAFEVPGQEHLLFHSDGGMNVVPDLADKIDIVHNALQALRRLGVSNPKVAVLTANEQVNEKIASTVHAQKISEMAKAGDFGACIIEGPISLDVAASKQAALHKGIQSEIAGDVDLFILPNIESGNILGKSLIYYARGKMAGLVLGATHPIVLTSRADTAEGKLYSIALACLMSARR